MRAVGLRAGGLQQLGLALDDGHDPALQRRRGRVRRGRGGQRVDGDLQARGVLTADRALVEVPLEAGGLVLGQRAQQPGADRVGPLLVIACGRGHVDGISSVRSWLRSFSSPSRIRPFTVPTGASRMLAISVCVKPPK